jgi:hypothetical protein
LRTWFSLSWALFLVYVPLHDVTSCVVARKAKVLRNK